jgi:hypothetical protein
MNRLLATSLAAAALALAPLVSSAQVAPGTELYGYLDQTVDSGSAYDGMPVSASQVHSRGDAISGARMFGHVADVVKAGQGRPGKIYLTWTRLVTASGRRYTIEGRTINAQVVTKNNAAKEAGGAVAGMIIGNILGKAIGTNVGGLLGAGGGYLAAHNNRQNVTIPANSVVEVQIITERRQG